MGVNKLDAMRNMYKEPIFQGYKYKTCLFESSDFIFKRTGTSDVFFKVSIFW